ncbi:ATP-dependent DNA helicase RecG [Kangiella sp. TOML190]|uniref:ATP-dependent DNA helicase RecG n=1 Tax=Kangiella sp. TOML190 TaxID=2931351 RepID=UPI00203DBB07|nr:ATP-dependent DNA helicase RecG [Kangiella sp. TOML190]
MALTSLTEIEVDSLKGVGPKLKEKLAKLRIENLQDLLFHLPLRYEDRTKVKPLIETRDGERAMIRVTVQHSQVQYGKRRTLICRAFDQTASIDFRFFHFMAAQQKKLQAGVELYAFGEVRRFGRSLQMVHPEITYLGANQAAPLLDSLTPIYPTTEGLHQASWRNLQKQALVYLTKHPVKDLLPPELIDKWQLMGINEALLWLHQPPKHTAIEDLSSDQSPAIKRLIYEELLAQQLSMQLQRQRFQQDSAFVMRNKGELVQKLLALLPFKPTKAQRRVVSEISQDLQSNRPMLRLLQGDVGAGKTLVAALCALQAIESGFQVALMAPTEILAEQHLNSFKAWCDSLEIELAFLVGKLKAAQRRESLAAIQSGQAQLVIGTHALFQEEVAYHKLGLAIIDEQHRFGVKQRLALKNKAPENKQLHQLMMTATPIPRTLAMTAYADMDLSIIDELPPGRTPVKTIAISEQKRDQVMQRMEDACLHEKRQVYWVCTLIEESEEIQSQAAETTANLLAEQLPNCRIGLIHGRLKSEQKQMVMQQFKNGRLDILVATTVIEVGVDVPNASLMIIENPERLGLAQLHQLRGRVGRGSVESHCLLLYGHPLSDNAKSRIQIMRETNDGFQIAEEDLRLRGPGEFLGTRQTGEMALQFADIVKNSALIPEIQTVAKAMISQNPKLAQSLCKRWLGYRHELGDV